MHDAALAFNLPGTAAYREAEKVFKHGMKHIERSRPLVLTPTPSPSPSHQPSPLPGDSSRATPARTKEIKPDHLIPEAMLDFPANSLQAKAVAWNLTGGRRVRAKRLVRGREKFVGKWRDMLPDGSYDVAEMDDPVDMLEKLRTRKATSWRHVPDWSGMRAKDEDWWDWEGLGGPTGQPPLPGTARLKPKELRMKTISTLEYGRFEDVAREIREAREQALPEGQEMPFFTEQDDVELLSTHLRPDPPRAPKPTFPLPPQNFVDINAGRPAADYLYDMTLGDVRGEAYAASVARFVKGAVGSTDDSAKPSPLEEYVAKKWHGGVLQTRLSEVSRQTANALSEAAGSTEPSPLVDSARDAYSRIALRRLTAATNPLDLEPLLREPSDFLHVGVGGKQGVEEALSWVGNEIVRVASEREREADKKSQATGGANGVVNGGDVDVEMAESKPVPEASGAGTKRAAEEQAEEPDAKRAKLEPEAVKSEGANGVPAPEQAAGVSGTPAAVAAIPAPPAPESKPMAEPSAAPIPASVPTPATAPIPASVPTPATAATPATAPAPVPENGLRPLRLELVALSKFYPLASLKKMEAADAARLLPANVRNLMTRQPPAPAPAPAPTPSAPTSTPSTPGVSVPASPSPAR